MARSYQFEGEYKHKSLTANIKLLLIHFKDDQNIHFIYSPHLDLTGYGESLKEAKESFKIAFEDFIDYTIKKKTLGKVLAKLGWQVKGSVKNPRKAIVPSITDVIKDNDYVSEIFDKYPVKTYHQKVGIPAVYAQ
jgi:hypothetical protein